jgi:hypothetical protein
MAMRLREGVSTAETDYGITLLDEDNGEYYNLNPTGALVLRTLLDGGSRAQAVERLTVDYAVDDDTAARDVADLVDNLRSAGLLEEEAATEATRRQEPA